MPDLSQAWFPNYINAAWHYLMPLDIKGQSFRICFYQNLTKILNKKKTTHTCTIHRGVWNLPHKFHLYLIYITLSMNVIPNFYSVCLKDVKDRNTIDLKHSLETKEKFCLSRRQFHFSFKILEVVDNFNTVNIRKPNIWNTDTCCLPYVG